MIRLHPEKLAYEQSLAEIINVLGFAYFKELSTADALDSFQAVQRICQGILKRYTVGPKPSWLLNLLALSQYNIGMIHSNGGETEKALQSYEESVRYQSALADSHPSVTEYQEKLGKTSRQIAILADEAHQDERAFRSIQRSVEVFEGLVHAHPDHASYHSELGLSFNFLGYLYDEAQQHPAAIRHFDHAASEQRLAISAAKDADDYKGYLCTHLDNLGEQYVDQGLVEDGLPHYEKALRIRRDLSDAHPESREYALDVAKALLTLGEIRRHAGEPGAASASFSRAVSILERWSGAAPGDEALQVELAIALNHKANGLADEGKWKVAGPLLEHAVALLRPTAHSATSSADDAKKLARRSEALWDYARVLRALNESENASRIDDERKALWKDRPPDESASLALEQATRAATIGHGKTSVSAPALAVRALDLDQAAANIRLAVDRGFKNFRLLRSHPDTAMLRPRADLESVFKSVDEVKTPAEVSPPK